MKDALTIKTRLDNVIHTNIPQSIEQTTIHNAQINVLEWLYNNGELRTEQEFTSKLQSIQEEILAYEFASDKGVYYQAAKAKLAELKNIN